MTNRKVEKPKVLTDAIPSYGWKDRTDYKQENRDWLKNSRRVALRILDVLEEKEMTQQTLADLLKVSRQRVSKIVKGHENFTFETVAKLENALGIVLIDIFDGDGVDIVTEKNILSEKRESVTRKIEEITNDHSGNFPNEIISELRLRLDYGSGHQKEFIAGESYYAEGSQA